MQRVFEPREIAVAPRSAARLARIVGAVRSSRMQAAVASVLPALMGRRIWHVNSTAGGGGVAEMLRLLVGYAIDLGVDTRWVVIDADADFFDITKRLHNRIHGWSGDAGELGQTERDHYESVLRINAEAAVFRVCPGDIVILHDPQTAGLARHFDERGAMVAWRCHIGSDYSNGNTEEAWAFLLPHLAACRSFVFSRAAFVPPELAMKDVWIIEPSIDPLSPKNRPLSPTRRRELLAQAGLLPGERAVSKSAVLAGGGPFSSQDRFVVQISRWDYLKDMIGVLHGFAEHVVGLSDARLALVGPAVDGIADDPEGQAVLEECLVAWEALPHRARRAVRLVALPMADVVANALMVNATQRHATVVVQKSLQEGFGLTVTEAMWKSRPVVASAVGGIVDQVPEGTGVLLQDPRDLDVFGRTVRRLLAEPDQLAILGRRARQHVREHFLTDRHLIDYAHLVEHLTAL
jgi:trehalose synthase